MENGFEKLSHWQDQVNIILAAWLLLAPTVLGYNDNTLATWSAYAVATMIFVLAIATLVWFKLWEDYAGLVLGFALAASPWLFGYGSVAVATWNHVLTGLLIVVLCGWELTVVANRPRPA